jgi:hypothetical protein
MTTKTMTDKPRAPAESVGGVPPEGEVSDFASFIISLGAAALHHLGVIPDPEGHPSEVNLQLAKYNIDIMGVLREKTRGNLTPAEERVFERLLYDVRMKYVDAQRNRP